MQVDPSALDDIKARLDDLDDAVRGIATLVSYLVMREAAAVTDGDTQRALKDAFLNLADPTAFESTRT